MSPENEAKRTELMQRGQAALDEGNLELGLRFLHEISLIGLPDKHPAKEIFSRDATLTNDIVNARGQLEDSIVVTALDMRFSTLLHSNVIPDQGNYVAEALFEFIRLFVEPGSRGTLQGAYNHVEENLAFNKRRLEQQNNDQAKSPDQ